MDINGFNLDNEYFGFGAYKSSARSNLDFLNFNIDKFKETEEYKKVNAEWDKLRMDTYDFYKKKKSEATTDLDKNAIDAEYGAKIKEIDDKYKGIIEKMVKDARIGKTTTTASKVLDTASSLLSGLGYETKTPTTSVNVDYGTGMGGNTAPTRNTTLWVVGGLAVAGVIGFILYKKYGGNGSKK